MLTEIRKLKEKVDQAATDYVSERLQNNNPLSANDAEAFEHLSGAKFRLEMALKIVEKQYAEDGS